MLDVGPFFFQEHDLQHPKPGRVYSPTVPGPLHHPDLGKPTAGGLLEGINLSGSAPANAEQSLK